MNARDVVGCHPVRTAIGAFNGALKAIAATGLGAIAVRETLRLSGLDAAATGSVILGNVLQAGNKMNPARQASIGGGVRVTTPAMTVNRVCGSGAQSHRHGGAANRDRRGRRRYCRRHGDHGSRAVSDGRRPLGLSHGSRGAT